MNKINNKSRLKSIKQNIVITLIILTLTKTKIMIIKEPQKTIM